MLVDYFLTVFLGTFVLEDVALALALGLVAGGQMMIVPATLACFLGIALGDLGLYFLGQVTSRTGLEVRFRFIRRLRAVLICEHKSDVMTNSIIISRFIPGTRLPTYFMAGVLHYPPVRFLILTLVTVFGWVAFAFAIGRSLRPVLMNHWLLTVILAMGILKLVKILIPRISDHWERRALIHYWRKYLKFEFWPATLFYLPLVPYYIFLSLRFRSVLAPFYANPEFENGGLIGESKWDFLRHLNANSCHTLKTLRLDAGTSFEEGLAIFEREEFSYPFILKPDVGQRGFGVRIIRNDFDLTEYLLLADFDIIAQELSEFQNEAGIFFVRPPDSIQGHIFSITDKHFPIVVGDGQTKLGNLILNDSRARIIAPTYFARQRDSLDLIPTSGEKVVLTRCGNHCQGTIFLNGAALKTSELEIAIGKIAERIPKFHVGRFDVRYKDKKSLMNGQDFEIVEINGAGAEATHIWDPETKILDAYSTLFRQWRILFEIGTAVQRSTNSSNRINISRLLKECWKVYFRKEALSVSS